MLCLEFYITMLVCGHRLITPYSMMEMNDVAIFKDSHFFLSKFSFLSTRWLSSLLKEAINDKTALIHNKSYLEESIFQAERNMTIFSCR